MKKLGIDTLAVGIGGIVGALARYGLSLLCNPADPDSFPWGTMLCNLSGCLLLGWLASLAENRLTPRLKLFLTTGVIGAFTTFSTFSLELAHLLQHGRPGSALAYALVSAAGGLLLTRLGMELAASSRKSVPQEGGGR